MVSKKFDFRFFAVLLLVITSGCAGGGNEAVSQSTGFRADVRHTGTFEGVAPRNLDAVHWTFETDGPIRSSPAIDGDVMYVGSHDHHLYALDMESGRPIWQYQTEGAVTSSPAVAGGRVYFTSRDEKLYSVSTSSGELVWAFDLGTELPYEWAFDYYTSSPAVIDGVVFVGSGDGHLYAVDAASGTEEWRFKTAGRVRSSPVVDGGFAYVGDVEGYVYAVDTTTGQLKWRFATDGVELDPADFGFDRKAIISSPSLTDDLVLVGGRDGKLYAINRENGTEQWRSDHGTSWVISSPAIKDGAVFVGTSDGQFVQAVDLATGSELWRHPIKGVVWSSPAVAGDWLYVGTSSGHFLSLDRETGNEVARFKAGDMIWSTAVVHGGNVYFGSDDGILYGLTDAYPSRELPELPRKVVFWDESPGYNWFSGGGDVTIRDYFANEGYDVLDESSLVQFMSDRTQDGKPSVVVFASNFLPSALVADTTESAPFGAYLDAGGKVVWVGCSPPAYARDPATGDIVEIDFSIPERLTGVRYQGPDTRGVGGLYGAQITETGRRWGLRGFYSGSCAVETSQVTDVLALNEQGMAQAWVKNFGGPEGSGLVQLWVLRNAPENLSSIQAAAEYGLGY